MQTIKKIPFPKENYKEDCDNIQIPNIIQIHQLPKKKKKSILCITYLFLKMVQKKDFFIKLGFRFLIKLLVLKHVKSNKIMSEFFLNIHLIYIHLWQAWFFFFFPPQFLWFWKFGKFSTFSKKNYCHNAKTHNPLPQRNANIKCFVRNTKWWSWRDFFNTL